MYIIVSVKSIGNGAVVSISPDDDPTIETFYESESTAIIAAQAFLQKIREVND